MTIEKLKAQMEVISGAWNGDNSGTLEDNAHLANEVLEHITAIEKLIDELNDEPAPPEKVIAGVDFTESLNLLNKLII
jgi:hypothetical protein